MGKICPKCGKELRETARFCTSCGTKLEEGMPENPVNTVNVQNGSINTVMPKQEKKWYQKTGWIIALLIVFFPVGLYLMWKYTDWRKVLKIAVSIVCAVCLVIGLFSISSQDGNEISLSSFVESYNEISQNKFGKQFDDMIEDYLYFYELKERLKYDIDINDIRYLNTGGNGFATYKPNESVERLQKTNGQMLKILQDLDLKTPEEDGEGDDLLSGN